MALNRLNDYLFKWTFGREEHKSMLLDFVNAVLTNGSDENIIVDFEPKNHEWPRKQKTTFRDRYSNKSSILITLTKSH